LDLAPEALWCKITVEMDSASATSFAPSPTRSAMVFAGWLVATFAAAAMGSFFLPGEWYALLHKPVWNPPNWIFGPVWTALYTIMAVAAWLVWKRGSFARQRVALSLFLLQLLFNALWSPLFFGLQSPGLAFVDLLALWLALLVTVAAFWKAHRLAGAMLLPYLAWVTFAGALNFAIWRLNPA
jgi:translocator protein